MTLYVDTSALVRRLLPDDHTDHVVAEMAGTSPWVTSTLTRAETALVLRRAAMGPYHLDDLWSAFHTYWDAMATVPVDDRCLGAAAEIGAQHHLVIADAIHLAAASRLPAPVRFLTLSASQLPAAADLGFDIVAPVER